MNKKIELNTLQKNLTSVTVNNLTYYFSYNTLIAILEISNIYSAYKRLHISSIKHSTTTQKHKKYIESLYNYMNSELCNYDIINESDSTKYDIVYESDITSDINI